MKISDQIRHAIESCGLTRYRIAKEAGISQSTLSRFMAGKAMSTECLDRLTELLGLSIQMTRPRRHVVALGSPRARRPAGRGPNALSMVNGRPVNPKLVAANAPLPVAATVPRTDERPAERTVQGFDQRRSMQRDGAATVATRT